MTTQILSNSPFVFVQKTNTPPWINMSNPSAGMVRYNGNNSAMEVYDGTSWMQISNNHTIETSAALTTVVEWANKKMAEEARLKELCKKFPALQKAVDNFEIIKALVEHENISN